MASIISPTDSPGQKRLLRALRGDPVDRPPFWYMRQAGRYLPEYRKVRQQAGGFLNLCYTPELAVEVTLQPLRRYGMDAVILFSDILVVPHGLGQEVGFVEGEGPALSPIDRPEQLDELRPEPLRERLAPVYAALAEIAAQVPPETAVIGFAGAPWTVASYMVEGGSSRDFAAVKSWAYRDPDGFQRLIDLLVAATADHLSAQIEAGADVVQIFDSWAGVLPEFALERWSLAPIARIAALIRQKHPDTPIMAFPRGVGSAYERFARTDGIDALSLDTGISPAWAAAALQPLKAVQGNLDPVMLLTGGDAMLEEAERILSALAVGPFVFNLGHGVLQGTPPDHVGALSDYLRNWRA